MQILDSVYGENVWKTPKISDYFNKKLISDERSKNIEELPFMFRYYMENATLNVNRSILAINSYLFNLTGIELTEIPEIDL